MDYREIKTPAFILDLDILEQNINAYQESAHKHNKRLWPMIKTHKSTEIAQMQSNAGASGFLAGTLDECESLQKTGTKNIMYAYPVADKHNISRVIELSKNCNFSICLDSADAACLIDEAAVNSGVAVQYLIIIDSGLHRFGVQPQNAAELAKALACKKGLKLIGITTHPGHVYAGSDPEHVRKCALDECSALKTAYEALKNTGFACEIVSSGSTPTFNNEVGDDLINMVHPGNYVFNDVIQIANGTAQQSECALSVLATVISHPSEDIYICNAGSKCLGLDAGAHGNDSIKGFGLVKSHQELSLIGLSEEVGKLKAGGLTKLKIGDKIEIIPNHACSAANMTGYMYGIRKGCFERFITVDMRNNSGKPLTNFG
ncbi:MAG: D-threo-3-hydroxyaspartate dehydratase [Firmicutes bacterium ADurb.Bin182]|nr:MAG: D-threo-3-hydroxyaspartate dehydratase [Firmicutes bacterium ADurb.Bin182]